MDVGQFLAEFRHIANAPQGVKRLRDLVLALAVQGRLVLQDPAEEPAEVQLDRIRATALASPVAGNRRKPAAARDPETTPSATLPGGWATARLCELVRVLNGRAYSKPELLESGTPVLRVGNLFTSDRWYYSSLQLEDDKYCEAGDLLYAWSASFGPFLWQGERVIYHYHIWKLDLFNHEALDKRFLHLWLLERTQEIKAAGHGINMAHMTKEKFEQFVVALPPRAEQSRIVAKVDQLMGLCDQLEKQQQERRRLQNALRRSTLGALTSAHGPSELQRGYRHLVANFDQLCSAPEDVVDLEQCIKQLALKGLLTSRVTGEEVSGHVVGLTESSGAVEESARDWPIPGHWVWARCGWLGEARLGKMLDASKNRGSLKPYLRNVNVRWRHFRLQDILQMRVEDHELPRITVRRGDLVICEGGEPGRAAIWERDDEFVIQKALHRFRCGPDVIPEYLLFCLEHDFFSGRLSRYYTGATIKHLTGKALAEYPLPLPPIDEQKRLIEAARQLSVEIASLGDRLGETSRCARMLAVAAISTLTGIAVEREDVSVKACLQTAASAGLACSVLF